jgi:hypothetical protein
MLLTACARHTWHSDAPHGSTRPPFFAFRLAEMKTTGAVLLAPSPSGEVVHDAMYYLKGAAAGGICCSVTHGALTPVDVVKTRVQLDPVKVRTISTWTMPPAAPFKQSYRGERNGSARQ